MRVLAAMGDASSPLPLALKNSSTILYLSERVSIAWPSRSLMVEGV